MRRSIKLGNTAKNHLSRVFYFLHTLRYLRPLQAYHQLYYRVRRQPCSLNFERPRPQVVKHPRVFMEGGGIKLCTDWQFTFLNHSKRFPRNSIDWRSASEKKLWRYNLHYFDYLLSPELTDSVKAELIDSWIEGNAAGAEDAWEPYPISLRVVNWIKYFQQLSPEKIPAHWLSNLANQVKWLEQTIEYHLLANHLFKNAVALVFAGAWFSGDEAAQWLRKGSELLRREVTEQFLGDGGHYERSPMYHSICVVDCLDVLNFLNGSHEPSVGALCQRLRDVTESALVFLRDMTMPDGLSALFNDAAHGIAPCPQAVVVYANQVLGRSISWEGSCGFKPIFHYDSGYFGYRDGGEGLLIDCGPIGPDYQPGHAHCDTLSFEWVVDGDRVVVDTGTFDYEPGPRRQYARGTCGHNTVMVDDSEQSEIWGVFRVARRARARLMRCEATNGRFEFEGGHDGYRRLKGKPYVSRSLVRERPGQLLVEDRVDGKGWHRVESRLHFRPGLRIVINDSYAEVLDENGRPKLAVEFIGSPEVVLIDGEYYPEFGIAQANAELVLRVAGALPLSVGYRLIAGRRV